jgi:hypothetical protein
MSAADAVADRVYKRARLQPRSIGVRKNAV